MDRRERDLRRLAKRYGVEVVKGRKHFKLVCNGRVCAVAAVSGQGGSLRRVEADLKAGGIATLV